MTADQPDTTAVVWLRPEYQGRETELIHLAAGAGLVGVTRAAVSNWAARHRDFPKVVMLVGPCDKRTKWVDREEFLGFARKQLNQPRKAARRRTAPRPRAVIRADQVAHGERQVGRLADLEARQAAVLEATRGRLAEAQADLQAARDGLATEIDAVQNVTKES